MHIRQACRPPCAAKACWRRTTALPPLATTARRPPGRRPPQLQLDSLLHAEAEHAQLQLELLRAEQPAEPGRSLMCPSAHRTLHLQTLAPTLQCFHLTLVALYRLASTERSERFARMRCASSTHSRCRTADCWPTSKRNLSSPLRANHLTATPAPSRHERAEPALGGHLWEPLLIASPNATLALLQGQR